jgi:hypothetical protein
MKVSANFICSPLTGDWGLNRHLTSSEASSILEDFEWPANKPVCHGLAGTKNPHTGYAQVHCQHPQSGPDGSKAPKVRDSFLQLNHWLQLILFGWLAKDHINKIAVLISNVPPPSRNTRQNMQDHSRDINPNNICWGPQPLMALSVQRTTC